MGSASGNLLALQLLREAETRLNTSCKPRPASSAIDIFSLALKQQSGLNEQTLLQPDIQRLVQEAWDSLGPNGQAPYHARAQQDLVRFQQEQRLYQERQQKYNHLRQLAQRAGVPGASAVMAPPPLSQQQQLPSVAQAPQQHNQQQQQQQQLATELHTFYRSLPPHMQQAILKLPKDQQIAYLRQAAQNQQQQQQRQQQQQGQQPQLLKQSGQRSAQASPWQTWQQHTANAERKHQANSARAAQGKLVPKTLAVTCQGVEGTMLVEEQQVVCQCSRCTVKPAFQRQMSMGQWEAHAGAGAAKKWRYSIKVAPGAAPGVPDSSYMPVGDWLVMHNIATAGRGGRRRGNPRVKRQRVEQWGEKGQGEEATSDEEDEEEQEDAVSGRQAQASSSRGLSTSREATPASGAGAEGSLLALPSSVPAAGVTVEMLGGRRLPGRPPRNGVYKADRVAAVFGLPIEHINGSLQQAQEQQQQEQGEDAEQRAQKQAQGQAQQQKLRRSSRISRAQAPQQQRVQQQRVQRWDKRSDWAHVEHVPGQQLRAAGRAPAPWEEVLKPEFVPIHVRYSGERCAVCDLDEEFDYDLMVTCDLCGVAVHQSCYGIEELPDLHETWLCHTCDLHTTLGSKTSQPQCCVCPVAGGPLKPTSVPGAWCHAACLQWIPELTVDDPSTMEPVEGLRDIPKDRWDLLCCVCRRRQGAKIQCSNPACFTAYHPLCGRLAGLHMEVMDDPDGGPDDHVRLISYCARHCRPQPHLAGMRKLQDIQHAGELPQQMPGPQLLGNGQPYHMPPAAPLPTCEAGAARATPLDGCSWGRELHGSGTGSGSEAAFWIPLTPQEPPRQRVAAAATELEDAGAAAAAEARDGARLDRAGSGAVGIKRSAGAGGSQEGDEEEQGCGQQQGKLEPVALLPLPPGVPEQVEICCNGRRAAFRIRTQRVRMLGKPGGGGEAEVSASRFEAMCGQGHVKKWKVSFYVTDEAGEPQQMMQDWLAERGLTSAALAELARNAAKHEALQEQRQQEGGTPAPSGQPEVQQLSCAPSPTTSACAEDQGSDMRVKQEEAEEAAGPAHSRAGLATKAACNGSPAAPATANDSSGHCQGNGFADLPAGIEAASAATRPATDSAATRSAAARQQPNGLHHLPGAGRANGSLGQHTDALAVLQNGTAVQHHTGQVKAEPGTLRPAKLQCLDSPARQQQQTTTLHHDRQPQQPGRIQPCASQQRLHGAGPSAGSGPAAAAGRPAKRAVGGLGPDEVVGRWARIYWPDDGEWYVGVIREYEPEGSGGQHRVYYEVDEQMEWVDLCAEDRLGHVQLLPPAELRAAWPPPPPRPHQRSPGSGQQWTGSEKPAVEGPADTDCLHHSASLQTTHDKQHTEEQASGCSSPDSPARLSQQHRQRGSGNFDDAAEEDPAVGTATADEGERPMAVGKAGHRPNCSCVICRQARAKLASASFADQAGRAGSGELQAKAAAAEAAAAEGALFDPRWRAGKQAYLQALPQVPSVGPTPHSLADVPLSRCWTPADWVLHRQQQQLQESATTAAAAGQPAPRLRSFDVLRPAETGRCLAAVDAQAATVSQGWGVSAGKALTQKERLDECNATEHQRVAFGKSGVHGWGLFARAPIAQDAMVMEYRGDLVSLSVADRREAGYRQQGTDCYLFKLDDEWVLDSTLAGAMCRFTNHSCSPSLYTKILTDDGRPRLVFFARSDLAPGQELTYNYRFNAALVEGGERLPCTCGAPNCAGYLN